MKGKKKEKHNRVVWTKRRAILIQKKEALISFSEDKPTVFYGHPLMQTIGYILPDNAELFKEINNEIHNEVWRIINKERQNTK